MREKKFRALKDDMSNYNFVYGNLIYDKNDIPRIQETDGICLFATCIKGTESQYIGIKDEHDVEIYEGDIIKHTFHPARTDRKAHSKIYPVEYNTSNCGFNVRYVGHSVLEEIEVIGNIYQNPELLE